MCQLAMQTLTMGGSFALRVGMLSSGRLVALTFFPVFLAFFDAPFFIIVLRISGATLPLHFALHPPLRVGSGGQLLTERDESCCCLLWHYRQGLRANVESNRVAARLFVLLLDEGMPFEHELNGIAVPLVIGSFGVWGGCLASDQSHILDRVAQPIRHNGIAPIDERWDDEAVPQQKTTISGKRVQHEAQAGIVALALHAIEAASTTFKAHAFGNADADPIDRLVGTCRQCLRHRAVNVLGDPAGTGLFGVLMKIVFGEVVGVAQRRERLGPLQPPGWREGTCRLPRRISAHGLESFSGFSQQGIIQTPSRLQVRTQRVLMAPVDLEGQFEEKAGCLCSFHDQLHSFLKCAKIIHQRKMYIKR